MKNCNIFSYFCPCARYNIQATTDWSIFSHRANLRARREAKYMNFAVKHTSRGKRHTARSRKKNVNKQAWALYLALAIFNIPSRRDAGEERKKGSKSPTTSCATAADLCVASCPINISEWEVTTNKRQSVFIPRYERHYHVGGWLLRLSSFRIRIWL